MHTAIGVFSAREKAEEAYRELVRREIHEDEIIFLTRSETSNTALGKKVGATVGGFVGVATGVSAGMGTAILPMVPGIGQVFAVGFGATALLGLAGLSAGSVMGRAAASDSTVTPSREEKCSEEIVFFRQVLAKGRTLVIVRSELQTSVDIANDVLNHLGIALEEVVPVKLQTRPRHVGDVAVLDLKGRITSGEGSVALRDLVRDLMEEGFGKILLNLRGVGYVDSSGLGELVKAYSSVRNRGRHLKLVDVSKRVYDLLQMTKLNLVLEIEADEAAALRSFHKPRAAPPAA